MAAPATTVAAGVAASMAKLVQLQGLCCIAELAPSLMAAKIGPATAAPIPPVRAPTAISAMTVIPVTNQLQKELSSFFGAGMKGEPVEPTGSFDRGMLLP